MALLCLVIYDNSLRDLQSWNKIILDCILLVALFVAIICLQIRDRLVSILIASVCVQASFFNLEVIYIVRVL